MGKLIRNKSFYRQFFLLTAALAGQNFLSYSVQLADNLMIGGYREASLSAVSLCSQLQFLLQMMVGGAGEGVVVIGAQYWGKKDVRPIVHLIGIALRLGCSLAIVLTVLAGFFSGSVLGLLTNDREIVAEAIPYLRIACLTYLIYAVTNIIVISLRSIGRVRIGFVLPVLSLFVNISLNYCLIYGRLGFPELGIRGAAIATLCSRSLELAVLVLYLWRWEKILCLNAAKLLYIDVSYIRDYVRISLPVLINQFQWGIAQAVQTAILGHMGKAAIAANSIAVMMFQILTVVVYGGAGAAGIITGRTVGAEKTEELPNLVKTFQVLFVGSGLVTGVMIMLIRTPVLAFYNITAETRELARLFMQVLAVTAMGTAYQMSCDNGILRGGGDTTFSARMNFVSMWFLLIPLASFAAFSLKCHPVIVFFLLKWDQLYKCIPVAVRLHGWRWVKNVTRTARPDALNVGTPPT